MIAPERGGGFPARRVHSEGGESRGGRGRQRERGERHPWLAERGGRIERDQHRSAAGIGAEGHDRHRRRERRPEDGQWRRATQHERAAGDNREYECRRAGRPRSTDHLRELRHCRDRRKREVERERAPPARPALVEAPLRRVAHARSRRLSTTIAAIRSSTAQAASTSPASPEESVSSGGIAGQPDRCAERRSPRRRSRWRC